MKKQYFGVAIISVFVLSFFISYYLQNNKIPLANDEINVIFEQNNQNENISPQKSAVGDDWLFVEGNRIVDAQGRAVLLSGINWFGFETSTQGFDGLWAVRLDDALDLIVNLGFNLLRLPLCVQLVNQWRSGTSPLAGSINAYISPELEGITSLELLDLALEYCSERGLKVMLDMHRVVNSGMTNLWYYQSYITQDWLECWRWLADRYAGNDVVVAMDVFNEPHGNTYQEGSAATKWDASSDSNNWKKAVQDVAAIIHAENPDVLIVAEGIQSFPKDALDFTSTDPNDFYSNWWGGNLRPVAYYPINLGAKQNKLVYSPHEYGPSVYPQSWFYEGFNKDTLYNEVWRPNWYYIVEDGISPLLIGEWGGPYSGDTAIWMNELVEFMDEQNLHQTFWCFNPNSGDTGGIVQYDWTTVEWEKYNAIKPVLWQDKTGAFVSLDHEIDLGANGTNIVEYYANGNSAPVPPGETPEDTTPPSITSPSDITYEVDTTGASISWTATDINPDSYSISQNGTTLTTGSWTSGTAISIDVSSLAIGNYGFTITVEDQAGNTVSDTVIVKITEATATGGEVWMMDVSSQQVGNIFDTSILVNTGTQRLAAYGIIISFDPSIVHISSVVAGADGFLAANNIDNAAGTLNVAGFDTAGKEPNENLHLLTIIWEAIGEGTTIVDIEVNSLTDQLTNPIGTPIGIDNEIVISSFSLGDVNHDSTIDIVDALLIAQYYVGSPVSIDITFADVNEDGSIDIIDSLLVAQYYVGAIQNLPPN